MYDYLMGLEGVWWLFCWCFYIKNVSLRWFKNNFNNFVLFFFWNEYKLNWKKIIVEREREREKQNNIIKNNKFECEMN